MDADTALTAAFLQAQPAAAARALDELEPSDIAACLMVFEPVSVAQAVAQMRPGLALSALALMEPPSAQAILLAMEPVAAARLLRQADDSMRGVLAPAGRGRHAQRLRRVMGYPQDTVGAWADPMTPAWQQGDIVARVIESVRSARQAVSEPLFVVSQTGRFVDCVLVADVIAANPDLPLSRLPRRGAVPLFDRALLTEVEHHDAWAEFARLPVIDGTGQLIGGLTRRALLEALAGTSHAAAAEDTTDILTGVTTETATWLAVALELFLTPHGRSTNLTER